MVHFWLLMNQSSVENQPYSHQYDALTYHAMLFLLRLTEKIERQCCSQNAEKVTHIKGRLLDQAVILFNCIPFPNGNFS